MNKIHKPLTMIINNIREKIQITKMKNEEVTSLHISYKFKGKLMNNMNNSMLPNLIT